MNKQKKIEWHAKRHETMSWLRENFPLVFGSAIKPLKVGIREDILTSNKEGMPQNKWIGCALRHYVHSCSYLSLMKLGATRFNLEGTPEGEVNAEEAECAKQALEDYKKKLKTQSRQIKAQRQALREKAKKEAATQPIPITHAAPVNTSGRKILTLKRRHPEIEHSN